MNHMVIKGDEPLVPVKHERVQGVKEQPNW